MPEICFINVSFYIPFSLQRLSCLLSFCLKHLPLSLKSKINMFIFTVYIKKEKKKSIYCTNCVQAFTHLESSFLFLLRAIFFSRTFLSLRASLAPGPSRAAESLLFCFLLSVEDIEPFTSCRCYKYTKLFPGENKGQICNLAKGIQFTEFVM